MARQVALAGKRLSVLRQAPLVADEVHQVGRILAIVDRESGVEADLQRLVAQQAGADRVEGAGPGQAFDQRRPPIAQHLAGDPLDAPRHLDGGPARKRHQQDAARVGAVHDEVGDAVRQRVGLARAGSGDDQERPGHVSAPMLDRQPLRVVQPAEIGRHVGRIRGDVAHAPMKPRFPFVRNRCRSSDEIDDRGCGSCAASPRLIACAHGEWEAQGLSGQARLRQDDRTSGRRRGRRWQPLRRAQALRHQRAL